MHSKSEIKKNEWQTKQSVFVQIRAAALGHAECVSVLRQHNPAVACYLNEATIPSGPLAGHTALSVAAMHGHHLVVHELLSADPVADVHNGPYHGAALLEAAMRGHGLVLELLLSHGCDPDCHRGTGRVSAMQHAINAKQWLICAVCPLWPCFTLGKSHTFANSTSTTLRRVLLASKCLT
jgi:hypothetical protein